MTCQQPSSMGSSMAERPALGLSDTEHASQPCIANE